MSRSEARVAKVAMSSMVGSLIVDVGAVLTPFHRKIRSSARQGGRSGDEMSCKGWTKVVDSCATCDWFGGINMGATMISVCLTNGLVAKLRCEY